MWNWMGFIIRMSALRVGKKDGKIRDKGQKEGRRREKWLHAEHIGGYI